jgi:hypothetical protein
MNRETKALERLNRFIDEVESQPRFANVKVNCQNAQEILLESQLPYLPILGFDIPHQEMLNEAKKLKDIMVPHRSYKEDNRGWRSICIHGISSAHTACASKYGYEIEDKTIYKWTDISHLAPITTQFFKNQFKYDFYNRVRFMLLEPGGYILPHKDFDHYVLGPINIALNMPDGCEFYMENVGCVPFAPGTINKLALVNRHAVINNSQEDRFHIIVHGGPSWNYWAQIFEHSYREMINAQNYSHRIEVGK